MQHINYTQVSLIQQIIKLKQKLFAKTKIYYEENSNSYHESSNLGFDIQGHYCCMEINFVQQVLRKVLIIG